MDLYRVALGNQELERDACGPVIMPPELFERSRLLRDVEGEGDGSFRLAEFEPVLLDRMRGRFNRGEAIQNLIDAEREICGDRRWAWLQANAQDLVGNEREISERLRTSGYWFFSGTVWQYPLELPRARCFGRDHDQPGWDDHFNLLAAEIDVHYVVLCRKLTRTR